MPQLTPYTPRSRDELLQNLDSIKEFDFTISEQELEEQINAIAAPIFDLDGQPIASISVAGPAYRLTRERMLNMGPDLVATAKEISQEIRMSAIPLASLSADFPFTGANSR